jgi:hypothetical protein
MTAENDRTRTSGAVQGNPAGGADPQPATPRNWDGCNESYCDLLRLAKATVSAAIIAGNALAAAAEELGDGFDAFITVRTPWGVAEARAVIRFATEVGLQADRLTPAHDVRLARLLTAAALMGHLYLERQDQGDDHPHAY